MKVLPLNGMRWNVWSFLKRTPTGPFHSMADQASFAPIIAEGGRP